MQAFSCNSPQTFRRLVYSSHPFKEKAMNGIDLHWMKDALYCSKTKPMHFGLAQDLKLISSFFFFFSLHHQLSGQNKFILTWLC